MELESDDVVTTHLLCETLTVTGPEILRPMTIITDRPVVIGAHRDVHCTHGSAMDVETHIVACVLANHDIAKGDWALEGIGIHCATPPGHLTVPFRTQVVVVAIDDAAMTGLHAYSRLAALSRFSGCQVGYLGFDVSGLVNANPAHEAAIKRTAWQFSAMKYAKRVVCTSTRAAAEVAGLVSTLTAQGLPGPLVRTIDTSDLHTIAPCAPDAPESRDWDMLGADAWAFLVSGTTTDPAAIREQR
jgi:hypothetical protein